MKYKLVAYYLMFVGLLISSVSFGQTREQLEKQRQEIQKELAQIAAIYKSTQKEGTSLINQLSELDRRVQTTERLIRINNQEANLLTKEIDQNTQQIEKLRKDLEQLKQEYASIINKSYKAKSNQSRIMFLLSSENFLQAYKRIQYMKQLANYRQKQGESIQEQSLALEELNQKLFLQKKEKDKVLAENRKTQQALLSDKKEQESLIAEVKKKEKQYLKDIKSKEKEIAKVDAQIEKAIKAAIAAANKKAGSSSKTTFAMTPEAKALASDFTKNKGKLPWPVKAGRLSVGHGITKHPVFKNLEIQSNGIRIDTDENGIAQAIFDGEVSQISLIRGGNKFVIVRHGDYISIYNNLTDVFVKNGQKIKVGQEIGKIGYSSSSRTYELKFQLYQNSKQLNPLDWILKMN